jgi:hypothetical protein
VNDDDDDDWDEMDDERASLKRKNDAKNGRFEGFDPKPKPGTEICIYIYIFVLHKKKIHIFTNKNT